MSLFNRLSQWTNLKSFNPATLNPEFDNIVNTLNNLDAGLASWNNVVTKNLTATSATIGGQVGPYLPLAGGTLTGNIKFNPTTDGITGTTTNDSAPSGTVGEAVRSFVTLGSAVNLVNVTWTDITNISLTAGDWDISGQVIFNAPVATVYAELTIGISSTSGNSSTGLSYGDNQMEAFGPTNSSVGVGAGSICNYRVSLSSTTIYYLKAFAQISGSTSQAGGRISARRIR